MDTELQRILDATEENETLKDTVAALEAGKEYCSDFIIEQEKEIETLREKLFRIERWCQAYPLDAFPEPDFKKARKLLEAGGMTLGSISASNMRHVLTGIQRIIKGEQ